MKRYHKNKPTNCICKYPEQVFRNGSGHAGHCPVHVTWMEKFIQQNQEDKIETDHLTIEVTCDDKLLHYTVISNPAELKPDAHVIKPLDLEPGKKYIVKHGGKEAHFEMEKRGVRLIFYPKYVDITLVEAE